MKTKCLPTMVAIWLCAAGGQAATLHLVIDVEPDYINAPWVLTTPNEVYSGSGDWSCPGGEEPECPGDMPVYGSYGIEWGEVPGCHLPTPSYQWYDFEYPDQVLYIYGEYMPILPDLAVDKTGPAEVRAYGDSLRYSITVTNEGEIEATDVVMEDNLPVGVEFLSASPTQGSCTEADGVVSCSLGNLAVGASVLIDIEARYQPHSILNTVSVSATELDGDPSDNVDSVLTLLDVLSAVPPSPVHYVPEIRLERNRPNPFNPRTEISFSIDAPTKVLVAVYDLAGHRVAVLVDEMIPRGMHTVNWDGRDSSGRPVASGTYIMRMEAMGVTKTGKVMVVR